MLADFDSMSPTLIFFPFNQSHFNFLSLQSIPLLDGGVSLADFDSMSHFNFLSLQVGEWWRGFVGLTCLAGGRWPSFFL